MENSALNKDLVFLTLQFLNEEGFMETAHKLECESGLYFNMQYFKEMLLMGKWEDAENYLSRFTRIHGNMYSAKIFFEIRKQKYLEALDNEDRGKALDILREELKVFSPGREELFNQFTQLLTIKNIREHALLSTYGNVNSMRRTLADIIVKLIEVNPEFHDKLRSPPFKSQRLYHLMNQSLNWRYLLSTKDPIQVPETRTFLMEHESSLNPSSLQAEDNNSIENPRSETTMEDHILSLRGRPYQMSQETGHRQGLEDGRPNSLLWNDLEICELSHCRFLQLPTPPEITKILRLAYTNEGKGILALASNGDHLVWKWPCNSLNPDGRATTQVFPQIWQPGSGLQFMSNKLPSSYSGDPISSFSLSNNGLYLMSTSGGALSLFSLSSFKTRATFLPPPPVATCLAFYPRDNNILAVGMDDFSVTIYHVRTDKIIRKLEGHCKRVSDLAFSSSFDLLVSVGVNDQIFVWNTNEWKKQKEGHLLIHGQRVPDVLSETHVQFHLYQRHFLVVRRNCLAMYEATNLKCCNQWVPRVAVGISQATFSSDGQAVYVGFVDGNVGILDTFKFQMRCRINLSTYLPTTPSSGISPLAIAANPLKPSQFVVGLADGRVFVFEPQKPED